MKAIEYRKGLGFMIVAKGLSETIPVGIIGCQHAYESVPLGKTILGTSI